MVDLLSRLNSLRVNRESRLDLPTPLSPIRTTLKRNYGMCQLRGLLWLFAGVSYIVFIVGHLCRLSPQTTRL